MTKDVTERLIKLAKNGEPSYGMTYTCPRCTQRLIDDQNRREKEGTWDNIADLSFRNLCDECFRQYCAWANEEKK